MKKIESLAVLVATMAILLVCMLRSEPTSAEQLQRLDSPLEDPRIDAAGGVIPTTGVWVLRRDRLLDGKIDKPESSDVQITFRNGQLAGQFVGQRALGRENDSVFSGETVAGHFQLIVLRQDDDYGYTAIHLGRRAAANRFVGTWTDNTAVDNSGDFELVLKDSVTSDEAIQRPCTVEDAAERLSR